MSMIQEDNFSPFLKTKSFNEQDAMQNLVKSESFWQETTSPFQSFYALEEGGDQMDAGSEEMATILHELYDREFDMATAGLIDEGAEIFEIHFDESESDYLPINEVAAEKMLMEHFAPLSAEMEHFLDEFGVQIGDMQPELVTDAVIDNFVEQYAPSVELSAPQMDFLFGFVKKVASTVKNVVKKGADVVKKGVDVAKKVAKKGIQIASALGLRPFINKLKPLINKIIAWGAKKIIKRLPPYLRPIAQKLRRRFLKVREVGEVGDGDEPREEIGVLELQEMLNTQLAQLVMAESEREQDLILAETTFNEQGMEALVAEANRAREQFIRQVPNLEEGENPGPIVEQFIPALLPIIKLGIRIVGKKRVQGIVTNLVSKAIRPFVGKKYTPLVAKLMVKAGWKALNLESPEADGERAAAEAVASIVEEVVRDTAALPKHVLENDELLETFVMESFEKAAAAYLPPVLAESVYEERPELRETTDQTEGYWLAQPRQGSKLYYKYTYEPEINISPLAAEEVRTWHGTPLSVFLSDRFRIPKGRTVKARVHLYQAGPKTLLSRISRHESSVSGLGSSGRHAWSQIHPLTPKAASILLGQPRMARKVSAHYLADPLKISLGQRLYFLEIMDAPARTQIYGGQAKSAPRCCPVHYTLDFVRSQIRAQVFLSEEEAQNCAVKIRRQVPAGVIAADIKKVYDCGLRSSSVAGLFHRAKIVHGSLMVPGDSRLALQWLPSAIQRRLEEQISSWLDRAIYQQIQQNPSGFVKATEDDALGLTIAVQFNNPPGFTMLGKFLAGACISLRDLQMNGSTPEATVQYVPGNWNG